VLWAHGHAGSIPAFLTEFRTKAPVVCLHMTDEDVIARVAWFLELGYQALRPSKRRWKTSYRVQIRGRKAVALMNLSSLPKPSDSS
jgi:hypothetical protein